MRVISLTGGKGGVGKTTLAVNLATAYAKEKKKVLLFDADLSLASVDLMLGLHPKKNINDYVGGFCDLNDICVTGPYGMRIIPAASGVQHLAELSISQSAHIIRGFSDLTEDVDVMIVDMAPGISSQVINFTHAAQDVLLVICNDPASLMDSYAVIKILKQKYNRNRFGIVVNKVKNYQESYSVFSKFQTAISQFIDVNLQLLGHVPQDDYIAISSREGHSIIQQFPRATASLAITELSHNISHWQADAPVVGGIHFFFERLLNGLNGNKEQLCRV